MLLQVGLCRTCSETTLLVFPRGGSIVSILLWKNNNPENAFVLCRYFNVLVENKLAIIVDFNLSCLHYILQEIMSTGNGEQILIDTQI